MSGNLSDLIERVEKASGPDREIDLAIHLALCPDGDIARITKYHRGLDQKEGFSWDLWRGSVVFEQYIAGRCPYNGGYVLLTYTASIDAALTLVPDSYPWTLGQNIHHRHWTANISEFGPDQEIRSRGMGSHQSCAALALCAAALKARANTPAR